MGETVVIELGELRQQPPPTADTARPAVSRRTTALAVAAALTATLGGAAPAPAVVVPVVIPAALTDTTVLLDDRYYVLSPAAGTPGSGVLSGYQLPDARLLSRFRLPMPSNGIGLEQVGPTLLVSTRNEFDGSPRTTALDAATGQVRWERATAMVGLSPSRRSALVVDNDGPGDQRWEAVDPATGQPHWSLVAEAGDITHSSWAGHAIERLVTLRRSGEVEVTDTETGTVTARANLPRPVTDPETGPAMWTSNGLLLLGSGSGLTAYGLDRLDRRWQSTGLQLNRPVVHAACGEVICIEDVTGTRAVDPDTGRLRWQNHGWSAYQRIGRNLLGAALTGARDGASVVVFDAATGRPRGTFGEWEPATGPRPDGRVIGLLRRPDGTVWVGLLDPETLGARVIHVADGVTGRCEVAFTALMCHRQDGSIAIWRLPSR